MSIPTLSASPPAIHTLLGQSWLALIARVAAALSTILVASIQLGGSMLLIAGGRYTWTGAAGPSGFMAIATLYAHGYWLKPESERQNDFFKHGSIIGGLVLLAILFTHSLGSRRP